MTSVLTSLRSTGAGTEPPRFVVRPAERADETAMKTLADASLAQRPRAEAAVPPGEPSALALLGELDDYGHPQAWVLVEGARLRAFFTLQVIPPVGAGLPRLWACGVHLDPDAPYVQRRGDTLVIVHRPAAAPADGGAAQAAVVLMYWLMHYAHEADGVRSVHLTLEDGSLDLDPKPVNGVVATVETQVPEQHRLKTCLARHGGTPTELPRVD